MMPPVGKRFSCPAKQHDSRCRPSDISEVRLTPYHPADDRNSAAENHQYERKSFGGLPSYPRQRLGNNCEVAAADTTAARRNSCARTDDSLRRNSDRQLDGME